MRQTLKRGIGLAAVVLILAVGGLPAGQTGKIVGRVYDASTKQPLPGANIILENTTMGAAADMNGNFLIIGVPPGTYAVRATMMGYRDYRIENVKVFSDKTTRLEFPLQMTVLEAEEAVTVVAERPLVQKDLTSTEAVIDAEVIEQLPVQNFDEVVNLQAGVVDGHFRGGRIGEVMYMIDGIPVNDVYSGNFALQVETNAIQELQVISGTFNAEYGQAMSGVVNIVTKEGSDHYTGEISAYFSDYVSNHTQIFWNIDAINPTYNLQGDLSGPLPGLGKKLTFYVSGRYFDSDGYLYGKDVFLPSDHSDFTTGGPENPESWVIEAHGKTYPFTEETARKLIEEADPVSMNRRKRVTGQLKLTYRLSGNDKISYEALVQRQQWRNYDHRFRLNPSGIYRSFQDGSNHILKWNHILSERAFFSLRFAHFRTTFKQYVYEDPFDPRYVTRQRLQDAGANAFYTGGMQMWHFRRSTTTNIAKFEITNQITDIHQIKAGVEAKKHRLWLHEYEIVPELPDRIPPITSFNNNRYTHNPVEASAYIQDKIELEYMIVNVGLRYDYFDPDGEVPTDFLQPDTGPKKKAATSSQLSPRLGIAYPITDKGVIHISYGHFFQIPNYQYLYTNPEFDVYPLQSTPSPPPYSVINTLGNASLKPQKTVIYEIGLQQQLGEEYALNVTVYYKDIRNLLGTEVRQNLQGIFYGRYINRDYGNVKGVTFAVKKRYSHGFRASIDYTFQIAKGNASDPNTVFLDRLAGKESTKQMVPLDWDRRHQINCSITFGRPGEYGISLIGRFGTGFPYTPTFQNIQTAVENSARRPNVYNVDLYAYKDFKLAIGTVSLFLRVFNLFDRLNELQVFTDTGRAGYSLAPIYTGGLRPQGINTLEQYYTRPDFYSPPREIQVGLSFEF